ncbi:MAG: type II toxin-antitoxin system HicB family antitoxin [Candidatus Vogelbacteria bacterium]
MQDKILQYNVIFRAEPEGGFTTIVPSLPGCISYGKDLSEAREMAVDAIHGYVESMRKHEEPVPSDQENFVSLISFPANVKVRHA